MGEESVLRALRACRPSKTRVLLNPIRIGRRPLTNKKLPRERASPMFSNPTAVTFIGYLIVMVGVGVFAYYYTRSYTDFILGGRSLGGFVTALSVGASDMSGWLLMGLPGAVFLFGVSQSWIAIGLILGSWLNWRFAAARLRVYTEKAHNSLTLPDYLTHRFEDKSNALRIIASAVILIFFTIYCASGVVAGARLFENTFHMEYETALIIGAAATILYVFIGGFLAVSWTDTIQAAIMCVALVVTPIAVMYDAGGFSATTARLAEINPSMLNMMEGQTVIGVISLLAWGLGYFGQPHILVRFMAAKSIKVIPNARRVATLWMLFCLAGAVGIRNHLDGFGGHEAHENMRLPEVTESPCQKTDDADNRLTFHHVEHARVDFCQTCCRRRKAARVVHDGNGGDDECNAHDGRLNGVGPADREEAADEHVKNRRCRTNDECGFVFHVEGVFKKAGPCDDA